MKILTNDRGVPREVLGGVVGSDGDGSICQELFWIVSTAIHTSYQLFLL